MAYPPRPRPDDRDARPASNVQVAGRPVEAVRGVDLNVGAGEIFGFLGPNGAGKTTTLRMLATLLTPTPGEATVAGADLRREPQPVRERIGYVPQGGSTDPAETGRGELVLQGRLYGMNKSDAQARAAEVLAALDLEAAADRTTEHVLGRDEAPARRRARHRPQARRSCSSTSRRPASTRRHGPGCGTRSAPSATGGTTVFLTTHYLEEADALADRLAIIDHGEIVAEGTADELKRQVAGDVVTIVVNGATEHVLEAVRRQSFVREATSEDGVVRLYVDRGETAVPLLLRVLDGAGLEAPLDRPPPPQPRRRLPPPDRSLAARRSGADRPSPSRPPLPIETGPSS